MIRSTSDAPIPAKTTDLLIFMVNSRAKKKKTLGSSNVKIRTEKKSLREHIFAKLNVHDSVREQKIYEWIITSRIDRCLRGITRRKCLLLLVYKLHSFSGW